jgi:hypothetical protein
MKQYVVTPAAGKRLMAKAMANHPAVLSVLESGTLVILAGTTNGYIAEEVLTATGQIEGFSRQRYHRGITLPPSRPKSPSWQSAESGFPGDVILSKGRWQKGRTIYDVSDELKAGDLILKGANALDYQRKRAAILIGHPKAGTIGLSLQAMIGKRVRLILPVGLEKCIPGDLDEIAQRINAHSETGLRFFPVPGEVFTEIEAIARLTGATAEVIGSGGVCGAEGSVWLAVTGTEKQINDTDSILKEVLSEPPYDE